MLKGGGWEMEQKLKKEKGEEVTRGKKAGIGKQKEK